ncbi:MAG: tRNA (adenosine(37)-N6)-dimethylallyltransferase MiaA [Clostridia bacterium]|nr:tRNA (adenosine(37)-N6)-dimethylallyltransferase MiaA [Clostridia bacterium]
MNKLLIICGPTASGKTDLAIECAKLLNTEIISADSLYIYKDLNIGTAKPTLEERRGVVHHLIDVVESDENFTVSQFKSIAEPIIYKLQEQNKIPIICGGTGFYINSLLFDLSYGKGEGNLEVREKYNNLAKEYGNQYVFDILSQVDKETADKLHPNDLKRVIRALEIYGSGVKKSEIKDDFKPKHDYKAFSINYPREKLYRRINMRVDIMLENGLIDEVKGLIDKGITLENQCLQGIGYKEIYSFLCGEISLEDAKELIKLNTRHYAKRQITFFKKLENHYELSPDNAKNLAKEIVKHYD